MHRDLHCTLIRQQEMQAGRARHSDKKLTSLFVF
jgi:hypothetical protein